MFNGAEREEEEGNRNDTAHVHTVFYKTERINLCKCGFMRKDVTYSFIVKN